MTAPSSAHRAMRGFPYAALADITGGGRVLVLAPHQDDESLGCGGLIAACAASGLPPILAFLTDGTGSHPRSRSHPPAALRDLREQEARSAAAALGVPAGHLHFLRWPDRFAPTEGPDFAAAVASVAGLLREHRCTRLLAPWRHDPHCDHLAAHRIAVTAAAEARVGLMSYPVWGWSLDDRAAPDLDGPPPRGHRLDIARQLPRKLRAIAAHASQHGAVIEDDPSGFALQPEMLAQFRQPYEVYLVEL